MHCFLKGNLWYDSRFIKNLHFITIKDTLCSWYIYRELPFNANIHHYNEPLRYNKKLQYARMPFLMKNWKEHGVCELHHSVNRNSLFTYFQL